MATVIERVKKIVIEVLGVTEDQVIPSASFVDDLNADSLDLVQIVMALEEEFSSQEQELDISDADAEKITTVQDAVNYIKNHSIKDEA